jgi:ketosteroid isomerase-like protein
MPTAGRTRLLQYQASQDMTAPTATRFTRCLSLLFLGIVQIAGARGEESQTTDVAATVLAFHAALAAGNAKAAANLLAPDAMILEGGERETREAYVTHHLPEDIKFSRAVPGTHGPIDVVISGDVAWATSTSVTQGTYQSKPLKLVGAELMILSRTPSGWQIRAIHWSSHKSGK